MVQCKTTKKYDRNTQTRHRSICRAVWWGGSQPESPVHCSCLPLNLKKIQMMILVPTIRCSLLVFFAFSLGKAFKGVNPSFFLVFFCQTPPTTLTLFFSTYCDVLLLRQATPPSWNSPCLIQKRKRRVFVKVTPLSDQSGSSRMLQRTSLTAFNGETIRRIDITVCATLACGDLWVLGRHSSGACLQISSTVVSSFSIFI